MGKTLWNHECFVVVQSLSHVWFFVTPWTAACQAFLSFSVSWSLLKLMSIESVMASNHLILCHPLLLLPSIFPSIRVFSNESTLPIRWPKYWSFSFIISPSNEYSGLTSLQIGWFDLLAVQGTLKSLQHHSMKASAYEDPKKRSSTCFKNRWEGVVTVSWVKPGGLQWEGGFEWGHNRWSERAWGGGNNWLKQSLLWFCPLWGHWVDQRRGSSRSRLFSSLLVLAGSGFTTLFLVF